MHNYKRIRNTLCVLSALVSILLVPNEITIFRTELVPHQLTNVSFLAANGIMVILQLYAAWGIWILTKKSLLVICAALLSLHLLLGEISNILTISFPVLAIAGIVFLLIKICLLISTYQLKNHELKSVLLLFGWTMLLTTAFAMLLSPLFVFLHLDISYLSYFQLIYLSYPITLFILVLKTNDELAKLNHVLAAINNYPNM